MIFRKPEIKSFYDDRLIISWEITQPKDIPPLKGIVFTISGEPELKFEPNQNSIIELPELKDNKIIVNWVTSKMKEKTEVTLTLSCSAIEETQKIVFDP